MLAKYFSIIREYVLSVSSQKKYTFYHQNTFLDAFRTNSRNIIGRNPSMVIPLLANQYLTPMLSQTGMVKCLGGAYSRGGLLAIFSPRVGAYSRGGPIRGFTVLMALSKDH